MGGWRLSQVEYEATAEILFYVVKLWIRPSWFDCRRFRCCKQGAGQGL